jgi:hypothetical protein
LIHAFSGTPDLCFDAGSASPVAGTNLQMQPCNSVSRHQKFAYTKDLNLVLTSTRTTAMPLGMCLDAAPVTGNNVQFRPCIDPPAARQRWSLNDSSHFQGTDPVTLNLNSLCFRIQTPNTAGSFVVLGACGSSFAPEAAVGAGAAGASSNQFVNFSQFGRCLDVTEFHNWVTYGYLISWPCKQAPDPTDIGWNQKWSFPPVPVGAASSAPGRITTLSTNPPPILHCLRSPGSVAPGQYVTITPCPGGSGTTQQDQRWTIYGDTGVYATSYRVTDGYGYCLTPTDPPDLYRTVNQISKIVVRVCDGSTKQKWNAPAELLDSTPLKDIGER